MVILRRMGSTISLRCSLFFSVSYSPRYANTPPMRPAGVLIHLDVSLADEFAQIAAYSIGRIAHAGAGAGEDDLADDSVA